jgi:acyl-CoA thioesterase-2
VHTVKPEHGVHSLHAYFILAGDLAEPVRYEVDRVRNGRSFTTRRVIARQSAGAILTLECSFQRLEDGPDTQSADMPAGVPAPATLTPIWDAGIERCDFDRKKTDPGSMTWARFPWKLAENQALHACALAYLSDMNAMDAIVASRPGGPAPGQAWGGEWMGVSIDHAVWFHRPVRADDWLLLDFSGHGMIRTRGLATGLVFDGTGTHVATIAQEGLLRTRKPGA